MRLFRELWLSKESEFESESEAVSSEAESRCEWEAGSDSASEAGASSRTSDCFGRVGFMAIECNETGL